MSTVLLFMKVLYNGIPVCVIEALTNLEQTFWACHLCTFKVAAILFLTIPTFRVLPYSINHHRATIVHMRVNKLCEFVFMHSVWSLCLGSSEINAVLDPLFTVPI